MIPYLKPAIIALSAVSIGAAGWIARGWFEDSQALAAMEAQQALAEEIRNDMGTVVRTVENQLKGLKANERIIDRGIIREVQRPVFRNVCIPLDSDAFRLLNNLAAGVASREPDDQSAADPAVAD